MMNYVIWGAGERGARLFFHLDVDSIEAFIDADKNKVGKEYCGKKIISFEEYQENFSHCYIIISILHEDEVVKVLQRNGIERYFLFSECPGEFQETNPRDNLKKYVMNYLKDNGKYAIYGCGLYALILNEWIKKRIGKYVTIAVPYKEKSIALTDDLKKQLSELEFRYLENLDLNQFDEILVTVEQDLDMVREYVDKRVKVTNIYDCSDKIEEYYNPKLKEFKNIHQGKRCFIVATGPSLRIDDLDTLAMHQEICISFNSIWKAFDATKWRPTYYMAMDYRAIRDYGDIMENENIPYMFWGDTYEAYWSKRHNERHIKHHCVHEYSEKRYPKFSEDFSRKSYHGATITYNALQLAAYMGFKEIYLLGVDFSYGGQRTDIKYGHFYKEEKLVSIGFERQVYLAYLAAKKYAGEHGIRIYNATRGGKLEVFERVDFDNIFNNALQSK